MLHSFFILLEIRSFWKLGYLIILHVIGLVPGYNEVGRDEELALQRLIGDLNSSLRQTSIKKQYGCSTLTIQIPAALSNGARPRSGGLVALSKCASEIKGILLQLKEFPFNKVHKDLLRKGLEKEAPLEPTHYWIEGDSARSSPISTGQDQVDLIDSEQRASLEFEINHLEPDSCFPADRCFSIISRQR